MASSSRRCAVEPSSRLADRAAVPDADDEHPWLLPLDDVERLVSRVGAVLDAAHLVRHPGLREVGVQPVEVRALGAVGVDEPCRRGTC